MKLVRSGEFRNEKPGVFTDAGERLDLSARYLENADAARKHIAGYVLSHDVSERAFQLERGGQWTKGKSCDTFNPPEPFLLTADEMSDPHALKISLKVIETTKQTGTTSKMIFDVLTVIHYLSQFMTLEPGDLVSTGTHRESA